jgi:hypothetical protein
MARSDELVRQRRIVGLGIAKRLEGRHLHAVLILRIVSPVPAMPDICAGRREKAFRSRDPRNRVQHRLRHRVEMRRESLHLLCIEDGVTLHERDDAFLILAGGLVGFGAVDRVGVDDQRSLLALAHMPAQFLRLPEGQPQRGRVAALLRRHPQHDYVDAAVRDAVAAQGPGNAPGGMFSVPRLVPWGGALREGCYNAVGHALINIGIHFPFLLGLRVAPATRLATRQ